MAIVTYEEQQRKKRKKLRNAKLYSLLVFFLVYFLGSLMFYKNSNIQAKIPIYKLGIPFISTYTILRENSKSNSTKVMYMNNDYGYNRILLSEKEYKNFFKEKKELKFNKNSDNRFNFKNNNEKDYHNKNASNFISERKTYEKKDFKLIPITTINTLYQTWYEEYSPKFNNVLNEEDMKSILKSSKSNEKKREEYEKRVKKHKDKYDRLVKTTIKKSRFKKNNIVLRAILLGIFRLFAYLSGILALVFFRFRKDKQLTTHGSQQWAELEDMTIVSDAAKPFSTDLLVENGVILGKMDGHTLRDSAKTHILVSAPTRTGKGVSIIIPTLVDSWRDSMVVLDIKGENQRVSSGYRKAVFNNDIINFAPLSVKSSSYNPLSEVNYAFLGGNTEASEIGKMVQMLSAKDNDKGGEDFWKLSGDEFIQGMTFFAIYRKRYEDNCRIESYKIRNSNISSNIEIDGETNTNKEIEIPKELVEESSKIANFGDVLDWITNPNNTDAMNTYLTKLAGKLPIATTTDKDGKALPDKVRCGFEKMDSPKYMPSDDYDFTKDNFYFHFDPRPDKDVELKSQLKLIYPTDIDVIDKGFHPKVARLLGKLGSNPEETLAGIIGNGSVNLEVFSDPIVRKNTSKSDFRILDLMNGENPTSLYLISEPKDIERLAPIMRIVVSQMVAILTPEMKTSGDSHRYRMLMLLDEFPAIGKLSILEKGIGYVAGYGMKIMIIVQTLNQLFQIYTKENMLTGNCQVQVFYTANDNETAQYISEYTGEETISYETQSGKKLFDKGSKGESLQSRKLLDVASARNLDLDKIILKVAGKPTALTNKIQYFKDPAFAPRTKIEPILTEGKNSKIFLDGNLVEVKNSMRYKRLNGYKDKDGKIVPYNVFESNVPYVSVDNLETNTYGSILQVLLSLVYKDWGYVDNFYGKIINHKSNTTEKIKIFNGYKVSKETGRKTPNLKDFDVNAEKFKIKIISKEEYEKLLNSDEKHLAYKFRTLENAKIYNSIFENLIKNTESINILGSEKDDVLDYSQKEVKVKINNTREYDLKNFTIKFNIKFNEWDESRDGFFDDGIQAPTVLYDYEIDGIVIPAKLIMKIENEKDNVYKGYCYSSKDEFLQSFMYNLRNDKWKKLLKQLEESQRLQKKDWEALNEVKKLILDKSLYNKAKFYLRSELKILTNNIRKMILKIRKK